MSKHRCQPCKSEHCSCILTSHSRKSRKRGHRKNDAIEWRNENQDNSEFLLENYDHFQQHSPSPMMHQSLPIQNGQRLFTAISDPSVCNFSGMPMAYAMEPVSLPHQMYRYFQPVPPPGPNLQFSNSSERRNVGGQNRTVPRKMSDVIGNGCRNSRKNGPCQGPPMCQESGDYASLPPTTTASINNKNSKGELGSEHRRYSDPGLGPADSESGGKSDDSDSWSSQSSITTISQSNKLVMTLVEQMAALKETNNQLFKELHKTKEDLQNVKSELSRLKQSTATGYQPGILSDIIRELREASKVREDALLTRVRSLLDDKSPNSQQVEELTAQVKSLSGDKSESDVRIARLEEELAAIKINSNSGVRQREIAAFEEENLSLRRELEEARASRNLAESQSTKLEKLVKILRKKMGSEEEPSCNLSCSEDSSDDSDSLSGDNSYSDQQQRKNNDSNNSSLASGPVTDL